MTADSVSRVLDYLRQAIVEGGLMPGEKVAQHEIAELNGMSRIPVREALSILAAEGSLTYTLNRGYTVPKLRLDELTQIYRMRALLEDSLILDIKKVSAQDVREFARLNKRMMVAAKRGDLSEFVNLNRSFHFKVLGLTGNHLIVAEINRLWAMSDAYRAIYLYEPHTAERSIRDHTEIISALEAGDAERCTALLHSHRVNAENHVSRMLKARESGQIRRPVPRPSASAFSVVGGEGK
jgi:DNA-binding GntR family transcriptional regulator